MLSIRCPNCQTRFWDDMPALFDGAYFVCPTCGSGITITMTWTRAPMSWKAAEPEQHGQ